MRPLPITLLILAFAGCSDAPLAIQGVVECDEQTLAFEVAGTVAATPVAEGAVVEAGTVLIRLDPAALRLALDEAEAQLGLARSELVLAEAPTRTQELASAEAEAGARRTAAVNAAGELRRVTRLHADGQVSDAGRDRAVEADAAAAAAARSADERLALLREGPRAEAVAVARGRVEVAQRAVARARERLERAVLVAPGRRTVRHVHLDPGEVAQPGAAAITVADLSRPYVDAFVAQGGLAALKLGGGATVRVDGHAPVEGVIERIGERLEFTPRYLFGPQDRPNLVARVRVRLASGEGLHAGVPADVVFAP